MNKTEKVAEIIVLSIVAIALIGGLVSFFDHAKSKPKDITTPSSTLTNVDTDEYTFEDACIAPGQFAYKFVEAHSVSELLSDSRYCKDIFLWKEYKRTN